MHMNGIRNSSRYRKSSHCWLVIFHVLSDCLALKHICVVLYGFDLGIISHSTVALIVPEFFYGRKISTRHSG